MFGCGSSSTRKVLAQRKRRWCNLARHEWEADSAERTRWVACMKSDCRRQRPDSLHSVKKVDQVAPGECGCLLSRRAAPSSGHWCSPAVLRRRQSFQSAVEKRGLALANNWREKCELATSAADALLCTTRPFTNDDCFIGRTQALLDLFFSPLGPIRGLKAPITETTTQTSVPPAADTASSNTASSMSRTAASSDAAVASGTRQKKAQKKSLPPLRRPFPR